MVVLTTNGSAETFYVSPSGSDSNDGLSTGTSFATIQRAANEAQPGDTVEIRGGTYREQVSLPRSGTAASPITFQAFNNEDVTITATDQLTGFTMTPETTDNNNVYVANLTGSTTNSLFNRHELTVFVDGQIVQEARSRNSADILNISTWDRHNTISGNTLTDTSRSVPFDGNLVGAYLHVRVNNFTPVRARITAASGSTLTVDRNISGSSNGFYLIHDARSLVDSAGEWFFDEENDQFYLWAPGGGDPDNFLVEVKRRADVFVTNSRDYIHFKNLTLTGGDFDLGSSDHLVLDGLNIIASDRISGPDFGTTRNALTFNGNTNRVLNCEFEQIWTAAIRVNGTNNVIANNHFHDICFIGGGAGGVVFGASGTENLVSYNTFEDSGRAAIAGSGIRNIFEHNDFTRIGRLTVDTGAFYYNEQNIGSSIIRYNTFHDISGALNSGVYTDNGVTDLAVHNNLFYNISPFGGKFNLPNSFLLAFNNTYFNSGLVDAFGTVSERISFGSRFYNNIYSTFDSDLLSGSSPFDFQGNFQTTSGGNFENSGSGDFRLLPTSGAVDSGIEISGITDGFSGNAPDAGAIEFGEPLFETGHNFASPPSESQLQINYEPVIFSNQARNTSFERSLNLDEYGTVGTPVITDDSSSSYQVDPVGRFGRRAAQLEPGDGITQTINGLLPNTTYTLTGQARIVGPILQAENASSSVSIISNYRTQGVRGQLQNNDTVLFSNVDFGPGSGLYDQLQIGLAQATTGTTIDLFLNSVSGSPLLTISATDPPNSALFYLSNFNLPSISGTHDIILRFRGSGDLGLLDEIRLVNTNLPASEQVEFGIRDFNGPAEISQMTGDVDFSAPRPTLEFQTGPNNTSATLFFTKPSGTNYDAYIDGVSVAGSAPTRNVQVDLSRTSYNYDLGVAFQPDVQSGGTPAWELLSPNTSGDISWTGPVGSFNAGSVSGINAVNQDFVFSSGTVILNHRLPNGRWAVSLNMSSAFSGHDNMLVCAEDQVVAADIDRNTGQFSTFGFEVDVNDGVLNLEFSDADSTNSEWVLNRLSFNRISGGDRITLISELTRNGSFENLSGAAPDLGSDQIGGSDTTVAIPNWTAVSNGFGGFDDAQAAASSDGSEYAFVDSGGDLTLTSSAANHITAEGDLFTLSFDVGSNQSNSHDYMAQLKFGSHLRTIGSFSDNTNVGVSGMSTHTFTYSAVADDVGSAPIAVLSMANSGGGAQSYLDNVQFTVIPVINLISESTQNGSFEDLTGASPNLGNNRIGGNNLTATIPNWTAVSSGFGGFDDDRAAAASHGSEYAFVNSNGDLTLTSSPTNYVTSEGDNFILSFDVGSNQSNSHDYTARLKFGSQTREIGNFTDDTNVELVGMRTYTFTYTATTSDAGNNPVVELFMNNSGGNAQSYIDNVRLGVSNPSIGSSSIVGPDNNTDIDNDGIPDWWEVQYFGDIISADASADNDQDGQINHREFIYGTDPLDPSSKFSITFQGDAADEITIQWSPVIPDREYEVRYSPDLMTPFRPVALGIYHPQASFTDTFPAGAKVSGFYVLAVKVVGH